MEVLPESYDERVSVLYSAIEGGLERLLGAARKKGVLHAPFGRPTPYSLYCAAGTSEYTDSDDSQSPQFVYDYGFNALGFLSDVLKKAHPEAVVERKLERLELFRELQRRAFFAQLQCADSAALRADAAVAAAGLACAPLTAPLSPNAVLVVVRPRCRGNLVVQISSSPDFTTELQTIKEPVTDVQSSCKVSISDLTPARQYYIRCCVEDESIDVAKAPSPNADIDLDEGLSALGASPHSVQPATAEAQPCFLQGPVGGVFETCRCWTLPAELPDAGEGEEAAVSSRPSSAVSESRATSSDAAPAHSPMFSLFLAGGMDRALTQHHTHTRSGVLQAWPALQLGAGFDMDSPALLPPAVDETDAWPPVLNSAAQHSIEPRPVISCLLGDVFPPPALGRDEDVTQAFAVEGNDMMDSKHRALFRLFRSSKVFSDPRSVLRNSSMLLAWNDASVGADVALKNEESVYKQWAHDKRKHDKKNAPDKKGPKGNAPGGRNTSVATGGAAPQLQRPPITPGLGALTEVSHVTVCLCHALINCFIFLSSSPSCPKMKKQGSYTSP